MPLDTQTIIWCVAIPAAIAIMAVLASKWLSKSSTGEAGDGTSIRHRTAACIIGIAWAASVVVGMHGLGVLKLWSEDGWSNLIWPITAAAIFFGPFSFPEIRRSTMIWPAIAMLAILTAASAMPSGDAWLDKLPLHRTWIAGMSIAAICNIGSLFHLDDRGGERWLALVVLVTIACPAVMGAAAYGTLLNVCLAALVVTFVFALFALRGLIPNISSIIAPSVLFAVTMISAASFYSYADVPSWAFGFAMLAPTWIAIADRMTGEKTTVVRVSVAAFMAAFVVGVTIFQFLVV